MLGICVGIKSVFMEKKVSLIKFTTNTVNEANIEDNDEYLNINKTTSQVNTKRKLNWKDSAVIAPKYVATPFPPLNFNQIGNICPKKVIRHANWTNSGKYFIVIKTGKYPFEMSKRRVIAAKNLFPVLSTFVAPIFPDPIFLTSKLPKNFVNNSPKGIEPQK